MVIEDKVLFCIAIIIVGQCVSCDILCMYRCVLIYNINYNFCYHTFNLLLSVQS